MEYLNMVFTGAFAIEALVKLIGFGLRVKQKLPVCIVAYMYGHLILLSAELLSRSLEFVRLRDSCWQSG